MPKYYRALTAIVVQWIERVSRVRKYGFIFRRGTARILTTSHCNSGPLGSCMVITNKSSRFLNGCRPYVLLHTLQLLLLMKFYVLSDFSVTTRGCKRLG